MKILVEKQKAKNGINFRLDCRGCLAWDTEGVGYQEGLSYQHFLPICQYRVKSKLYNIAADSMHRMSLYSRFYSDNYMEVEAEYE